MMSASSNLQQWHASAICRNIVAFLNVFKTAVFVANILAKTPLSIVFARG
jgi:hypothetical protein